MRILNDKETGLLICSFENVDGIAGVDAKFFDEFTQELNSWRSSGIKNFLLKNTEDPLGFFYNNCAEKSPFKNVFYAFEDGKLVGSALVSSNLRLTGKDEILSHIDFCEQRGISELEGYLTLKQAKQLIINDGFNSTYIELLAVKPNQTGNGIGSRFISCIKNNIDFFDRLPTTTHNTLATTIHECNDRSLSAFTVHNDFKPVVESDAYKFKTLHDFYSPFDNCEMGN